MTQVVHKNCSVCQSNTDHTEVLKWVCLPKYLVLAISRFAYVGSKTVKNNTPVPVQAHVSVDGTSYSLVGIIHHHGGGANSGHYTSTLFNENIFFDCNDMMITESSHFKNTYSDTAYIMVYGL